MKKICLTLLALVFCLNSFAATGVADDFARIVDDYQYSLTVDWDQKDQAMHEKITNKFYEDLDVLTKGKGLKTEEMEKMLMAKVKDAKVLNGIRAKIALMGKDASREELMGLLRSEAKNLYSSGSSWNGDATLTWGIAIVVGALIAYAVIFQLTHTCVRYEQRDYKTCTEATDYGCDYSGFNCGTVYLGYTECKYESYCAEYEKNK